MIQAGRFSWKKLFISFLSKLGVKKAKEANKNLFYNQANRHRKILAYMRYDPKFRIWNNKYFEDRFFKALRAHNQLSFALIDLDFLKKINDARGYVEGDRILSLLSRELMQLSRKLKGGAGRCGGDEFAIFAPCSAKELSEKLSELREKLLESKFSFSFGISNTSSIKEKDSLLLFQKLKRKAERELKEEKKQRNTMRL